MGHSPKSEIPYQALGGSLKQMRIRLQETLAEVSGAVEIDIETLNKIEQGFQRPAEEILLLLITHFSIKEDEATRLWELAGYSQDHLPINNMINDDHGQPKPAVLVMPNDARIVYTDMVHVMVNNYGVVMNFMQGAGPGNQPLAVARIGMSKEHARSVLEVIQQTLEQAENVHTKTQSALPAPKADQTKSENS